MYIILSIVIQTDVNLFFSCNFSSLENHGLFYYNREETDNDMGGRHVVYILAQTEKSANTKHNKNPESHGPSISASHRRPYADNDPRQDFRIWVARNNYLIKIGMGLAAIISIILFWLIFA